MSSAGRGGVWRGSLARAGVWAAFALFCAPFAHAQVVTPAPYVESVRLLDEAYMYPDELDAFELLEAAARRLERRIDWLFVDVVGGRATVRHGNGVQLGAVVVTGMHDLAAGLYGLEQLAMSSGYHLGDDVDIRLETLIGMTGALDRYSRVLAGERLDSFDTRLKGSLVGIGATLGIRDNQLTVIQLIEGGPAEFGGLLPEDRIVRIDDASTVNMPVDEAVRRIRGEEESTVRLTVRRVTQPRGVVVEQVLTLVRRLVTLENVRATVLDGGVPLIAIDSVSQRTVSNLRQILQSLSDRGQLNHGVLLDLRGNSGGSLKDSAGVVDAFVTSGNLITTRGPDGGPVRDLITRMDARDQGTEPPLPLVVLVDRQTASGAEIIAGALQGLGRAVLLGERTFGKGEVQKLFPLEDGVSFKMTIAEYQVAGGVEVARRGVLPDRVVNRVQLDEWGARFVGWDPAHEEVPWEAIVPQVDERTGWRQLAEPRGIDLVAEAARRAVLAAADPSREAVLAALDPALAALRVEQERHLFEAFAAKGIDWSPATTAGAAPEAVVELSVLNDPADPSERVLRVSVRNVGPTTLRRTVVRLASPDHALWDGLVVPIGAVRSGAVGVGEAKVRLRQGVDARRDRVVPTLITDRRPPVTLAERHLDLAALPRVRLRVAAQILPDGDHHVAAITLTNLSDERVEGLEAWFSYPEEATLELLDRAVRVPELAPRGTAQVRLGLRIGEGAPPSLPLRLVVEAGERGTLEQFDLHLRPTGELHRREGPRIEAKQSHLAAPAGPYTLPLLITDDSLIDSVVVFVNDRKTSWERVRKQRLDLRANFTLLAGSNTVVVVATDDDGDVFRRSFRVFGEGDDLMILSGGDTDLPAL